MIIREIVHPSEIFMTYNEFSANFDFICVFEPFQEEEVQRICQKKTDIPSRKCLIDHLLVISDKELQHQPLIYTFEKTGLQ